VISPVSSDLPFTIAFELPPGWALVSPDACGHPDAAYVAIRQKNVNDLVVTNFAINGFLASPTVDVAALAARYLASLQSRYPVTVLKSDISAARMVAQLLQLDYTENGSTIPLKQIQIINALPSVDTQEAIAVLQMLLTCPVEVFDEAGPEFQQFMTTITPGL